MQLARHRDESPPRWFLFRHPPIHRQPPSALSCTSIPATFIASSWRGSGRTHAKKVTHRHVLLPLLLAEVARHRLVQNARSRSNSKTASLHPECKQTFAVHASSAYSTTQSHFHVNGWAPGPCKLKNQRSLRFPGASIGPKYFLQMVEDLFWLLTRKTVGYGRLFVHHLHRTVFRISPRLYYPPQSRPWPGYFDARNRLGLLSHTAALAGGRSIREQLLLASVRRYYGVTEALTWLCSSDRRNLRQRLETWPQIQRNTVFSAE
mgnify:CR=1 FL=1